MMSIDPELFKSIEDPCACTHERGRHEELTGRCLDCIEQIGCNRFTEATAGTITSPKIKSLLELSQLPLHSMVAMQESTGVIIYEKASRFTWIRMRKGFANIKQDELWKYARGELYLVWQSDWS